MSCGRYTVDGAAYVPYIAAMDTSYETALLGVASEYDRCVAKHGGKSLARVATIVVNRGSFFERLRDGGGCSARNLDKMAEWFREPANWPDSVVPEIAAHSLASIGRPVLEATPAAETEQAAA